LVGSKQHLKLRFELPSGVLPDIEPPNPKRQMIVYGEVTYLDIFDKPHRTEL
jgi:hypothetical protein